LIVSITGTLYSFADANLENRENPLKLGDY